ncbi:phage tail protein [Chromobacterium sp. IIBBL 290-4]|uniref:phage tail protein n=1 Tax=Chromobacterium sp. IIBBL 290-4 TaxID=2953890 RepID=UPI0020B747ED|nr:tail fiber protein [Chromobacterium sp. IIBBL 290-4]UTH76012.1 tail fiber protein [Chromobacterium sp. IIBBL 290-4]
MQDQLKSITSPDGLFHDGNPATGDFGTIVTSEWLNGVQSAVQSTQQEVLSVIKSNGQNPDPSRKDQLLQAVQNIAWGGSQKPTTLAGYGIADGASKSDLKTAIDSLVASAPDALNTLKELADALGRDQNFSTTVTNKLANKADKATTLAGYGISDGATATQVNAAAPAGMVAYFAMKDAPAGWLVADGRAVNRKDYPALFAAISTLYGIGDGTSTFVLPDLCGEFIRGWDIKNAGKDPGRTFGSWQAPSLQTASIGPDALQDLVVEGNNSNNATVDDFNRAMQTDPIRDQDYASTLKGYAYNQILNAYAGNSFGKPVDNNCNRPLNSNLCFIAGGTRPRNVALLACIKC